MTNDVPHPYSLEIIRLDRPVGHFGWALRRNGTLIQRSDRPYASEAKAHENGMKAVEEQTAPSFDKR